MLRKDKVFETVFIQYWKKNQITYFILLHQKKRPWGCFFSTHVSKYRVGTLGKYSYILVKGSLNYTNFASTVKPHQVLWSFTYQVRSQEWAWCPVRVSGYLSNLPFALIQHLSLFMQNLFQLPTLPLLSRPGIANPQSLNTFHNLFVPFPFSRFFHHSPPHFIHVKSECFLPLSLG